MSDFNLVEYGRYVRSKRTEVGLKTVEDFIKKILLDTNCKIGKDSLYRIEQGKQEPTATQFFAINMTLARSLCPDEVAQHCLSDEWSYILASKSFNHGYADAREAVWQWKSQRSW